MDEFLEMFAKEVDELMDKWYHDLDELVNNTLQNMSSAEEDMEENYLELQKVMIDAIHKRLACVLEDEEG